MESKIKKRVNTIGIIIIVFGCINGFNGLIGSILFFANSSDLGIKHFYQHPLCYLISGLLLILSGILLRKMKRISIPITSISSIIFGLLFLSTKGPSNDGYMFEDSINKVLNIGIYGLYFVVCGLIILLIFYLIKIRNHFIK